MTRDQDYLLYSAYACLIIGLSISLLILCLTQP